MTEKMNETPPADDNYVEDIGKKRKMKARKIQHNKRLLRERRKSVRDEKSWEEYVKFMNANLEKQKNYHESPHIVISRSLHLVVDNSIILKTDSVVEDASLARKFYYNIDRIGKNVKIKMKNTKYRNIKIDEIIGRRFLFWSI